MFTSFTQMILFSSDHGHTLVDNFDPMIEDHEQELAAEIWDTSHDEYEDTWSGWTWDYFPTDSTYVRPNIF